MQEKLRMLVRRVLPVTARRKIIRFTRWPPVGLVHFGSLRRLRPISDAWGTERGQPIDRFYIERFLADNASDIQGRVLEIGNNSYTVAYGGKRVGQSDVLHVAERKSNVSIIGDLTRADHILSDSYDCIILTQTLQSIFELEAAVQTVFRILKPGGVVLVTVPGISKVSRYDMDRWGYFWAFTTQSAHKLFATSFPDANIQVEAHGNVLVAIAFLHGLASKELSQKELGATDPDYEVLITVRAQKPVGPE